MRQCDHAALVFIPVPAMRACFLPSLDELAMFVLRHADPLSLTLSSYSKVIRQAKERGAMQKAIYAPKEMGVRHRQNQS